MRVKLIQPVKFKDEKHKQSQAEKAVRFYHKKANSIHRHWSRRLTMCVDPTGFYECCRCEATHIYYKVSYSHFKSLEHIGYMHGFTTPEDMEYLRSVKRQIDAAGLLMAKLAGYRSVYDHETAVRRIHSMRQHQ